MDLEKLSGVASAVVTPRLPNGYINLVAFDKLLEQQYEKTDFIVVLGTTGEAEFLHDNDRELLVEKTINYFKGDGRNKPVVVGASAGNTEEAISRSHLALQLGADALLITPPPYVKPRQNGIVYHYDRISEATNGAPLVIYNVPSRVGVNILPETLEEISAICNIIAVKEASGDLSQLKEYVIKNKGDYVVLSGDDATTYQAIERGADGVISVVSNIAPEMMSKMVNNLLSGDDEVAFATDQELQPLYEASMKFGNPVSIKALMRLGGYEVGETHPSLGSVNEKELTYLIQSLEKVKGLR